MTSTEAPSGLFAGHTATDHDALVAAGVDPTSTQPRERVVPCSKCGRPTWHQAGCCDAHYEPPAACRRTPSGWPGASAMLDVLAFIGWAVEDLRRDDPIVSFHDNPEACRRFDAWWPNRNRVAPYVVVESSGHLAVVAAGLSIGSRTLGPWRERAEQLITSWPERPLVDRVFA